MLCDVNLQLSRQETRQQEVARPAQILDLENKRLVYYERAFS
jgi:hypothetical protein